MAKFNPEDTTYPKDLRLRSFVAFRATM